MSSFCLGCAILWKWFENIGRNIDAVCTHLNYLFVLLQYIISLKKCWFMEWIILGINKKQSSDFNLSIRHKYENDLFYSQILSCVMWSTEKKKIQKNKMLKVKFIPF